MAQITTNAVLGKADKDHTLQSLSSINIMWGMNNKMNKIKWNEEDISDFEVNKKIASCMISKNLITTATKIK